MGLVRPFRRVAIFRALTYRLVLTIGSANFSIIAGQFLSLLLVSAHTARRRHRAHSYSR